MGVWRNARAGASGEALQALEQREGAEVTAGVYQIVNLVTGKRYIGSSVNVQHRMAEHRRDLKRGRHHSRYLQASWNKHGAAAFEFRPLLLCSVGDRLFYEQLLLDGLRPEYNGFPNARSPLGFKHSEETKAKWRGRKRTPEHCAAISRSKRGKPIHTPESLKRMAEFNFAHGIKPPSQKGKPKSPEHRAKIAAALKGNKNTLGYKPKPETLKKMSLRMMGNAHSRGYKYSDERKRLLYASRRKVNLPDPSVLE